MIGRLLVLLSVSVAKSVDPDLTSGCSTRMAFRLRANDGPTWNIGLVAL